MADLNEIKNYVEKRSIYDFLTGGNIVNNGLKILIPIFIVGGLILAWAGQVEKEELNYTWNKTNPGDSLYAEDIFVNDSTFTQFHTFRLIRPLAEADVEKMNIPKWKKLKMIAQLDTFSDHQRPVMIDYARMLFLQDDMFKKETAFIGTYIKRDSTIGMYKETIYIPLKWYAFKPNYTLCNTDYIFKMPANYTFADSNHYVEPSLVRLQEPAIFRNKKK